MTRNFQALISDFTHNMALAKYAQYTHWKIRADVGIIERVHFATASDIPWYPGNLVATTRLRNLTKAPGGERHFLGQGATHAECVLAPSLSFSPMLQRGD